MQSPFFRRPPLRRWLLLAGIPLLISIFSRCAGDSVADSQPRTEEVYWGHVDTVSYVGAETCRACHAEQYSTYVHTGMGRSWGAASRERSDADYTGHPVVRDEALDLSYRPFWRDDSLRIAEFRLRGSDTVHYREETVDWIVGSGHHTNSHLIERNGYLTQAPITFYTQRGKWDLAPGFEAGFNTRFSRMIETECITCHNGLPEHREGSLNAYEVIPSGIDCERCHGPGGEHVRRILAGKIVDTATQIDYSIVNPGRLSVDLQMDLCQRCHLQGIAVLQEGVDWFDFRPGEVLSDHWEIFLPRFKAGSSQFLMASQAERLRKSQCYIESGAISCIECHNPHRSVKSTSPQSFDKACLDCHGSRDACTEVLEARQVNGDHCSGCHMPAAGSVDIPHVSITDHRIAVPGRDEPDDRFSGLECLTSEDPSEVIVAKGYLKFYEAFKADPSMLDSAAYWLGRARQYNSGSAAQRFEAEVHLAFLRKEFDRITALGREWEVSQCQDAWTCYRTGQSYTNIGEVREAQPWLDQAVALLPAHLEFRKKRANGLASLGRAEEAAADYRFVIEQDPRESSSLSNLGFILLQEGRIEEAESLFKRAARWNPDYLPARTNLVQVYAATDRSEEARALLRSLEESYPDDLVVRALSERLNQ